MRVDKLENESFKVLLKELLTEFENEHFILSKLIKKKDFKKKALYVENYILSSEKNQDFKLENLNIKYRIRILLYRKIMIYLIIGIILLNTMLNSYFFHSLGNWPYNFLTSKMSLVNMIVNSIIIIFMIVFYLKFKNRFIGKHSVDNLYNYYKLINRIYKKK